MERFYEEYSHEHISEEYKENFIVFRNKNKWDLSSVLNEADKDLRLQTFDPEKKEGVTFF